MKKSASYCLHRMLQYYYLYKCGIIMIFNWMLLKRQIQLGEVDKDNADIQDIFEDLMLGDLFQDDIEEA